MRIDAVIDSLRASEGPSRRLDVEIAQMIGWRLRTETVVDVNTGEQKQKHLWLVPQSEELGKIPFFTSELGAAFRLSQDIAPSEPAAFCWEHGQCSAQVGNGPAVIAANAAIALCLAVLVYHQHRFRVS